MSSLLNKLRAAKPMPAKQKTVSDSCYALTEQFSLSSNEKTPLSTEDLFLLAGIQDVNSDIQPQDIVFFDTETTGLSGGAGTIAFLLGIGRITDQGFTVHQYLMRDYHEEIFILQAFKEHVRQAKLIVTFNGASFDIPLMRSRLVMHRMHEEVSLPIHLDLLPVARRVYKLRIGKCSLASLEEHIFHEKREDDLPGSMVPEAYFKYLKTGNLAVLEPVLTHNAKDVLSLVRLLYTLKNLHNRPQDALHQEDLFSLGKVHERRGKPEQARCCYRAIQTQSLRPDALSRLANISLKASEVEEAARLYEHLRLTGQAGAKVYISLAKIYEHRFKQYGKALDIARQGMLYCSERLLPGALEKDRDYQDLVYRHSRLMRKVRRD